VIAASTQTRRPPVGDSCDDVVGAEHGLMLQWPWLPHVPDRGEGKYVTEGELAGKVALVAGGTGGMGSAIVMAAVAEGTHAVVLARDGAKLRSVIRKADPEFIEAVEGDATDADDVHMAIEAALRRWGRLDALVNAVGSNTPERSLDALAEPDWQHLMHTNVTAAFVLTKAVVPVMREQGNGTIIHISSMAARRSGRSNAGYQAAKAGVAALGRATREEEKANGIRVTVVFPGLTDTPLLQRRADPPSRELLSLALQPEDVASACLLALKLPARACLAEIEIVPSRL
jgi:NADP-dependent 3-hydroxy acid dehydrogenase YdfG